MYWAPIGRYSTVKLLPGLGEVCLEIKVICSKAPKTFSCNVFDPFQSFCEQLVSPWIICSNVVSQLQEVFLVRPRPALPALPRQPSQPVAGQGPPQEEARGGGGREDRGGHQEVISGEKTGE